MSANLKGWIDSFADDVAAVKQLIEATGAPKESRVLGAAALNYLVTRMDLIPDWEETAGILDDAMVLRVAVALASEKDLGKLDSGAMHALAKLANEADAVAEFLGADLYPRLKKYVQGLVAKEVRGRRPDMIVDDAKVRKLLYGEVAEELKAHPPAPLADPAAVERTVKNYLAKKL